MRFNKASCLSDCTLRLWLNTGTVNVTVSSPNSATPGYSLTTANNSFTNTCPFTINYLCDSGANGGITAGTNSIVAGCYIGKPPTTTFNGVNLALSGASSSLPCCRIYFSQIQVEPTKALTYVEQNRNKKLYIDLSLPINITINRELSTNLLTLV